MREEEVEQFFRGFKILHLDVLRDATGTGVGEAYVEFESEEVMLKAMSRNRVRWG